MTDSKFERIGVNLQYDATTIKEANDKFAYSCECCCAKGRYADCNRCTIANVHMLLVAYFSDRDKKENNNTWNYYDKGDIKHANDSTGIRKI